jgi:hypothetical protein
MSRCHVRCRACQARKVLRVTPDEYVRLPKCGNCGAQNYRVDGWMNSRDTRKTACSCAGYIYMTRREWPHRQGSPYCWFRKDGTQRFEGDADYKDFQQEQEGYKS